MVVGGEGDESRLINQYYRYRIDKVLCMVFLEDTKSDDVAFFCHMYRNFTEYTDFAKLCLHLLTLSLDSVECGALYASHSPCPSRLQHPWPSCSTTKIKSEENPPTKKSLTERSA